MENNNLIAGFDEHDLAAQTTRLRNFNPYDAKYAKKVDKLRAYLTQWAELKRCAKVQLVMLHIRTGRPLEDFAEAFDKFSPVNADLLEDDPRIAHDQLAVIEELGRHLTPEEKALLHPGTTSYDILDTARNSLFKEAWFNVIRPIAIDVKDKLIILAEKSIDIIAAGRTHLQITAPVSYGRRFSRQAQLIAEQIEAIDTAAHNLRGKISGIVGTGAGISMVVENQEQFELDVLNYFNLKPDYTASQIVQKQRLVRFGNEIALLGITNAKFANDVRLLYSSGIGELTSRSNKERLGGSSSDATKNNPINYENMTATQSTLKAGMIVLYDMLMTDLERDLRDSKLARIQPQSIMVETYESLLRMSKALDQLSLNEDVIEKNLDAVRKKPGDAMTTILRGEGFIHSTLGIGHDFVKEMAKRSQKSGLTLLDESLKDIEFVQLWVELDTVKQEILKGHLEFYLGNEKELIQKNLERARKVQ